MERNVPLEKNVKDRKKLGLPSYSTLEEVFNATTHGVGTILSIVAMIMLIFFSNHNLKAIICCTIYSSTLFTLYIVSTLYHALPINKAKQIFRVLDHCSIFILITGTYLPVCVLILNSTLGISLFAIIASVSVLGIVLNSINLKKFSKFSMICYIVVGWAALFAVKPLFFSMSFKQFLFLFLGGCAYTLGAVLYNVGKKVKYIHSVWHLFVLIGSVLHFFMIFDFIKN